MNPNPQNSNAHPELKAIPWVIAGICALISLISFVYFKDFFFFAGVVLGGILAVANFVFLSKIVVKMLNENYKHKTRLLTLFVIKLLFIALVAVVAFKILKVPAVSFALGYLSLVPAVMTASLWMRHDANMPL